MKTTSRRLSAAFAALSFAIVTLPAAETPAAVTLKWLDGAPPAAPQSLSWGVPWPKGALKKTDSLALTTADGKAVPVQTWPLAYWPDGSVKWSGEAIAASADTTGPLQLAIGPGTAPATPLTATETATTIDIDTGSLRCRINKQGGVSVRITHHRRPRGRAERETDRHP